MKTSASKRVVSETNHSLVLGCSATGQSHARDDVPCQDAWSASQVDDSRFVIAVGDGLGSAKNSHVGSHLATSTSVARLDEYLRSGGPLERDQIQPVLKDAFQEARQMISTEAQETGQQYAEFNTTLMVLVAGPSGVAVAGVGDGGVVGHRDGEHFLMLPEEDTEYANVTRPVTNENWEAGYRFRFYEQVDAVAMFSDGLAPFAWSSDAGRCLQDIFFDQIFGFVRTVSDVQAATEELRDYITADHFQAYSGDDKTLVIGEIADEKPQQSFTPDIRARMLVGYRRAKQLDEQLRLWLRQR